MLEYSLFHQLPLKSQVALLAQSGTALAQRHHQDWCITLYALDNYFLERWEKNGLEIVGTFKQSASPLAILEPYLDNLAVQPFLEA